MYCFLGLVFSSSFSSSSLFHNGGISGAGSLDISLADVTLEQINYSMTVQSTADYYPFGMKHPTSTISAFGERHDYQGDFSEKDEETGWNSFELRMLDTRIARWLSPDPYRQFHSPYIAMGNNPITYTDPDGGCIGEECDPIAVETGCQCSTYDEATGMRYTDVQGLDFGSPEFMPGEVFGNVGMHGGWLQEVTVDANLTEHEKTMYNPGAQAVYKAHRDFLYGVYDVTRYTTSQTGAYITYAGYGTSIIAPPVGGVLLGVGGTLSTIGGTMNAGYEVSQGNYTGAAYEAGMIVAGRVGGKGIDNLQGLNGAGKTILKGNYNTKLNLINEVVSPQISNSPHK